MDDTLTAAMNVSRKRTREDTDEGTVPAAGPMAENVKRDQDVWFEDGNVVLQAGGIAFRVYQGLLTLNSEVFADMFSVPQPNSVERFDGCPVIHLADHPDDLRHLLRVLFVDKKFYRRSEQFPCTTVAALARLAHKYEIKDLLHDALDCLSTCFSDIFATWAAAHEGMGSPRMSFDWKDAIAVVNIARLTDTASMLPAALYMCCQLDTDTILNGAVQKNGTVERLSAGDTMGCLDARKTLVHDNIISAFRIFSPTTSDECTSPTDCIAHLTVLLQDHITYEGGSDNYTCLSDWIPYLQTSMEHSQTYDALCTYCTSMVRVRSREQRADIWMRLPQALGVDVQVWDLDL